ncbi:MAG: hypothetical protein AAGE52_30175 [Myxococcota bacterium]
MSPEDKTRFVQIVGQVLIADGILGDAERDHLERVMNELGLSDGEKKTAMRGIDMDSPVEERVKALSPEARTQLVEAVEKAVAADGETKKSEQELVAQIKSLVGA